YSGCRDKISWMDFVKNKVLFLFILFLISAVRELLAYGTIFEISILPSVPIEIASGPIGAFIIVGGLSLILYVVSTASNFNNELNQEKEVGH
ncbi:MAG: hypothetical protein ACOCQS_01860, partial [Bacillota bacterium]